MLLWSIINVCPGQRLGRGACLLHRCHLGTLLWTDRLSPDSGHSRRNRYFNLKKVYEQYLLLQTVKNSPASAGDQSLIPGLGRSPWRREWVPAPVFLPGKFYGELGGLQSMGSQRVRHDWATNTHTLWRFRLYVPYSDTAEFCMRGDALATVQSYLIAWKCAYHRWVCVKADITEKFKYWVYGW